MSNPDKLKTYLLSARVKTVVLPEIMDFNGADFSRLCDDLIIRNEDGSRVFIRGFFGQQVLPSIAIKNGEQMSGDMAAVFVKLSPFALAALLQIDRMEQGQIIPVDSAS